MADLNNVVIGLALLRSYTQVMKLDYVPNSFPNGSPNNPSQCYIAVEAGGVNDTDAAALRDLGWVDEGDFFCYYD
jgi:hypothetical protein